MDGPYDVYLALGVWEHDAAGPNAFAREAKRVVKLGGRIIVSVPFQSWLSCWRDWQRPLSNNDTFYQHRFTVREFHRILQKHGFYYVRTAFYGSGYAMKRVLSPQVRRRARWTRFLPFVNRATAHMLFVVAEKW